MNHLSLRALALSAPLALGIAIASTGSGMAQDTFKVGMAVGGMECCEWMKSQGDVARALAAQRGWDYYELSNKGDAPTALKNAGLFIQEDVDVVIQFNGQPSVNPALAQRFGSAGVPVITYDIAEEGMYFVGIDNLAAGLAGGEALGQIVKEKWNCEPDLVISAEGAGAGIVNTWRTGGMRDGLKRVCPDIPEEKWVSFESVGQATVGLPAARDLLAAHPNAKRMAVVGLNDGGVLAAINAAEQLGRADEIIGWGQDGAFITGPNVNPHLAGSVFYFLEGYAVYAFRDVIDHIASGNPPPVKHDAGDPASRVQPCPVSAEQAQNVPGLQERVAMLLEAPAGTTAYDLFCPNK
ncbi:MAG: substrate-binding domain-containing protein [Albidovulum sp.]|nr:substrate-binding domain-containing protein [Albidovulum sp.]MDE0530825.1 substrate-binding domain-containing protein [Albidovulum sp.]